MTEAIPLRGGHFTLDPRLDRIPQFDERSRNYQIRELLGDSGRASASKFWKPGPTLDQRAEGMCVSMGTHDARNGSPINVRPREVTYEACLDYYHRVQHADPWPGCYLGPKCPIAPSKDAYGGTSTLTGMELGRQAGWWREYRWIGAGSGALESDIIDTLRRVGGIVFGVPWLEGMYETNPDGLVDVSGAEVGGHCIHGVAWVPRLRLPKSFKGTKPAVAWHNSWGDDYGVRHYGRTGIGFVLLDDLLGLVDNNRGEGAVPIK